MRGGPASRLLTPRTPSVPPTPALPRRTPGTQACLDRILASHDKPGFSGTADAAHELYLPVASAAGRGAGESTGAGAGAGAAPSGTILTHLRGKILIVRPVTLMNSPLGQFARHVWGGPGVDLRADAYDHALGGYGVHSATQLGAVLASVEVADFVC